MKRKHNLYVGEIVFDVDKMLFGTITKIEDGTYTLDMTKRGTIKPYFDLEKENREMFDCDLTEDDLVWTCEDADALYQIAWGIVDSREGNLVCFEHNKTQDDYPFYSPYLDENLFTIETDKKTF